jgi:hypothetical protein
MSVPFLRKESIVATSNAASACEEDDTAYYHEMLGLVLDTLVSHVEDHRKIAVQRVLKDCTAGGLRRVCLGLVKMAYNGLAGKRAQARASLIGIGLPALDPIMESFSVRELLNRQLQLVDVLHQIGLGLDPQQKKNLGQILVGHCGYGHHELIRLAILDVGATLADLDDVRALVGKFTALSDARDSVTEDVIHAP